MRRRDTARLSLWTLCLLLVAGAAAGADYLDESRTITGTPQSGVEEFTFTLEKGSPPVHIDLDIDMSQGRADVRIFDPWDRRVAYIGAQGCTVSQPVDRARRPGTYRVEVTTTEAVGSWHVRLYEGPPRSKALAARALTSAGAMMLVAAAAVWLWRRLSGAEWKWFWVGAALWIVAVAVKFAIAIPLNERVMVDLKEVVPYWAYVTVGATYGGVMTGVTEILFTLIAALRWRQMAETASRGVAVGVGAGAFEAALIAFGFVGAAVVGDAISSTWGVTLVPAAERVTAILCHTASRSLVLLGVARRRYALFWYGFLLMSGVDAVAMLYLIEAVRPASLWVTEAMYAPFGLVSIPITIWCIRHWPAAPAALDAGETSPAAES